jgi:excisionase family DNA binding protein
MKEISDKMPKKEFEPFEPAVLTVPELARVLRIGRTTAYKMVQEGQIPAMRIGKAIRIPRQAVENYLQKKGGRE